MRMHPEFFPTPYQYIFHTNKYDLFKMPSSRIDVCIGANKHKPTRALFAYTSLSSPLTNLERSRCSYLSLLPIPSLAATFLKARMNRDIDVSDTALLSTHIFSRGYMHSSVHYAS